MKPMSKYHIQFSKEFKAEAVRLLLTSGKTAEGLGRELGVTGTTDSGPRIPVAKCCRPVQPCRTIS